MADVPVKRCLSGIRGIEERLPSRFARETITGQASTLRVYNDYSKDSQKRHEAMMKAAQETMQEPSLPYILTTIG